ncbi:MAG TPA: PIN domain-containing protein [Jatrophihabitantaceae bacterium]|jgi:predicted nucleic acid-binding protein
MDAFDADALIYAGSTGNPHGEGIRVLISESITGTHIGSVLLVPEVLIKPTRMGHSAELSDLKRLLARLSLRDTDPRTVQLAVRLGARYGLKTVDAVHLATAVLAGADRFVTNNRRDFTKEITEVDVTYPDEIQ